MFNNKVVIKQRGQSSNWICCVISLLFPAFVIIFIPFSYHAMLLWYVGLALLTYGLIRLTMGFRSWVIQGSDGKYIFCIRDNYARCNVYVPFEYITHAELCSIAMWRKGSTPPAYIGSPYHRIYSHFGYEGPGLIVSYMLPRYLCADQQLRSWEFPAPKAEEFLALLKANTEMSRAHKSN